MKLGIVRQFPLFNRLEKRNVSNYQLSAESRSGNEGAILIVRGIQTLLSSIALPWPVASALDAT